MATLFFIFKATSTLFSIVALPIYIPTNNVGGGAIFKPLHYFGTYILSVSLSLFFFFLRKISLKYHITSCNYV